MKDLIERLEKATGPDRELDCYIWAVVNGKGEPVSSVGPPTYEQRRFFCNPNPEIDWIGYDLLNVAEHYTSSLDAALTLVPEGIRVVNLCASDPSLKYTGQARVLLVPFNTKDDWWTLSRNGNVEEGEHKTSPAIALCIAALKVRGTPHD